MSDLSESELTRVITLAVHNAIKKERDELWIPSPEHFLHHQFIKTIMERFSEGEKIKWRITITGIVIFILGAIVVAIKELFK